MAGQPQPFEFTEANFRKPELPAGLAVRDVPVVRATDEALRGFGRLIPRPDLAAHAGKEGDPFGLRSPGIPSVGAGDFEIVPWPRDGPGQFRKLDPGTGDEAGTTEGEFLVRWDGDFYMGE